jgi:hypothetical protein
MRLSVFFLLLAAASCRRDASSDQQNREQEFSRAMSGATLVGRFSSNSSEKLSGDRYQISNVSRLAGDLWIFQTRIQYGSRDVDVPVPVKILWAGDTPVITLTDATIPGLGSFTARVVIYRDQYAGTWSNSKGHGGQMFGRIER